MAWAFSRVPPPSIEVGRDPSPEIPRLPELALKPGLSCAAPDHLIGIDAVHRPVRQHPGSASGRTEEGGLVVIAEIGRGEIFIEELLDEIALDIRSLRFSDEGQFRARWAGRPYREDLSTSPLT